VCSGFIYGWSSNYHNSSLPTQQISPTLTPEPTAESSAAHRTRLRTVNTPERLNQEIRRRTRVVGVSPNEADCLRLVTALTMETSDKWEDSKVYLVLTN